MPIYQAILTTVLVAMLLNTINNMRLLRRPPKQLPPADGPLVSILIPARNEARGIARCVESLAQQDYPHCEILVLDDQSEDQTAAIVEELARRYPHVRLLRGKPLPPNWHGKAYACAQLAQAARGEWLLFVDADTTHAPESVSTALRVAQERQTDLLTMMPRLLVQSFGEALLLPTIPLIFVAFLPLGLVTGAPWPLLAGALGPFLLFRRDIYLRIGGHEAVRTDIVEDMELSRLVKRHGGRLDWIDGTELVRVRMYQSLGEAWRGLAKSSFAAVNYSLPMLLVGLPICAVLLLGPYAFLVVALIDRQASATLLWLPLGQIAAMWTSYLLLAQRFQLRRRMVFLHAGTVLAIFLFTLYSAYQVMFGGGVAWKGRTYQFGARRQRVRRLALLGVWLRTRVAAGLPAVRLLIAAALVVLGWRWGASMLRVAAMLPLAGWTCAVLEEALKRDPGSRLASAADVGASLASLAYLLLSGLLPITLVLLAILLVGVSVRLFPWRVVAAIASALLGSVLLITAGTYAPALDMLLIGWVAGIVLLSSRSVARAIIPWLQRLRSP
jgi:chlorobactene glucosyltransferase